MIDHKELNINSDVFIEAREKFDAVLKKLLKNMIKSNSTTGSITLKVDVGLTTETIPDITALRSGEREIKIPSFDFKISSQVAVKDEDKGFSDPRMELVFDPTNNTYILKHIADTDQRSIFDSDFN